MIAKGGARADPRQLGPYLMRTGRYDTGEEARLLDMRGCPWEAGIDATNREKTSELVTEALCDWQLWCEGTRQGRDGIYHSQVSPAPKYAKTMTDEQWRRCADILAEELGFENQPRIVVWQAGDDGRPHLHIAWARTDLDTMKVIPDSYNYLAHERATKRMELEFGHEFVAGKHAKRDRENQPEFPRADSSYDDHMHADRTGMSLEERREQVTGLRQRADNAEAFKNALEEAGYLLARGDRRRIVLVDEHGEVFSLSKHVTDIKGKAFKEFMAPIEEAKLPSVDEAKALQRAHLIAKRDAEKRESASKSDDRAEAVSEPQEKGVEASKFLKDQTQRKSAEPAPRQESAVSGAGREDRKPEPIDPERKQKITALRAWADGAQAFRHALEEEGYKLARGGTGYVLVSEDGVFNLARHAGMRKSAFEAFMSPIPLDSLPDVKELIESQKQTRIESKFLGPVADAPQPSSLPAGDIDLGTRMETSALDTAAEAIAEAQRLREQSDLDALKQSIAKRHEEELAVLQERHAAELRFKEVEMDRETARYMENYARIQDEQTEAFLKARKETRTGLQGFMDAIESRWNPNLATEKAQSRQRELENFYRRLAKERADYEALLQQNKQMEIENTVARQRLQLEEFKNRAEEEQDRYIREHHEAKRLLAEIEQDRDQEKELERNDSLRDGPPPPKLGK